MPRNRTNDDDSPSHDSFLDVVANMVGILIILVMVAGVRVKNSPVPAAIIAKVAEADKRLLDKTLAEEQSLRSDVFSIAEQTRDIEHETSIRNRNRELLATAVSAWQHKLDSRRKEIGSASREVFDLSQKMSLARQEFDKTEQNRRQVEAQTKAPVVIKSYPTPLSETVDGEEIHFQLRGGRIAYIPIERLADRMKASAKRQINTLLTQPAFSDTVGPIGGFRMRFTIVRRQASRETQLRTGQSGMRAELLRWTLAPASSELGETVDEALAERSRFRAVLSGYRPGRTTVTVWTYEDGFSSFRELKKELYLLGFDTAARPLSIGMPISGSPDGSRSAAQ